MVLGDCRWLQVVCCFSSYPQKVNHHPVKCGGHRNCGSGDLMILVCHVISQDYVIIWSCDFIGRK